MLCSEGCAAGTRRVGGLARQENANAGNSAAAEAAAFSSCLPCPAPAPAPAAADAWLHGTLTRVD